MATAKKSTKPKSKDKPTKRLVRSQDRMFLGVCGGIGDYLGIDGTVIRILWVLASALTGFFPGLIAYIVIGLITPDE